MVDELTQEALGYLVENGCQVSHRKWDGVLEEEAVIREIQGVDAVIAGNEPYTAKVFDAADRLRIVARAGAGFDAINLAAATKHGVWVTNAPGADGPAVAVADFTIGLILCLVRNIHGMARDTQQGKWKKFRGRELNSLTLGILGAGSIGRRVIKRARGFGMKVLAYDVQPDNAFAAAWQVKYVPLDDLLARSDVVSVHVLLDRNTRKLINEHRLKLMKKTAYLIDTSRPAVVDKAALAKVLQARGIAGAALDVHDPIPLAPEDPLGQLDNVLLTPWSAAYTEESVSKMSMTAARNAAEVLQGRAPPNSLNQVVVPANVRPL
jgi:phosphoglycerate dehydrogenase-like enzyme